MARIGRSEPRPGEARGRGKRVTPRTATDDRRSYGTEPDIDDRKKAEEKGRQQEARLEFFKHVIDQTHDPIFWQSPADGFRFVYVNQAACRHSGRSAEELCRMSVSDVDPNYPL